MFAQLMKGLGNGSEDLEGLEKEFSEGNILMPIDKRDFENLRQFKKDTANIPHIQKHLDNLDEDFKNRKFDYPGANNREERLGEEKSGQ